MGSVTRRTFLKTSTTLAAMAAASRAAGAADEMAPFRAGAAVRDVTPAPGLDMWGYSARTGPATGTLDPLYAKAAVFAAPGASVAVVALDMGRMPLPAVCDRIRARVRNAGIDQVMFTATHTHHGPALESEDAPHVLALEQALGECIEEAAAGLRPARIGVGRATADIAHNRRIITPDGQCLMLWRNEEKKPTAPVDYEMVIVRVDGEDGAPITTLVNFACHPVVMGPENREYSGDYAGEMARRVSEKTGAPCLFLQGGCGDINPYLDKTPIDDGAVEAMRGVGQACADAVLAALPAIQPAAPEAPSLACSMQSVNVGARFDTSKPEQVAALRAVYGAQVDLFIGQMRPDLSVPVGTLVLNNELALVFVPGEFFVQYQLDMKRDSPLPNTLFCGYANEFHLYFPTIVGAAAGGYGGLAATYVGVGAGDKVITAACTEIGKLSGRLKEVYAPEDFALDEA